ncbi:MAG: PQQ-dependent sugar dehydrogenase [Solirubrobacteraceae bacterium]
MVRIAAGAAVALVLVGCGSPALERPEPARSGRLLTRATGAAALVALPRGGLRFGELDGRIRDVTAAGSVRDVVRLRVAAGGQRGLLGLAVDARGRTFAAYVTPGGRRRLVVARVAPGPRREVWRGPPSTDLANGGHLAFAPDGRLTIGVGDLQDPAAARRANTVNGKLLALDPGGRSGQRPRRLSGGWNNPFAFAWTPRRELWVADNAPGGRRERVARADPRGRGAPRLELSRHTAPSGLAALGGAQLALCGYVSHRLERVVLEPGAAPRVVTPPLATDCALGVARLTDGRIAYATRRAILVLRP